MNEEVDLGKYRTLVIREGNRITLVTGHGIIYNLVDGIIESVSRENNYQDAHDLIFATRVKKPLEELELNQNIRIEIEGVVTDLSDIPM